MPAGWQRELERWEAAGLLDAASAERIRSFEAQQEKSQGFRWPTLLAIALGALLLAAGVLLFVSAHWEELAPSARFALVLLTLSLLHGSGALAAPRFNSLAISLHAVGTVALGAGIALTGQIFNLAEHWPGGILLWATGAAFAWAVLRHWTQAALLALLVPAWLSAEWIYAMPDPYWVLAPLMAGLSLLAFTYLSARMEGKDDALRQALAWIGGLALFPSIAGLIVAASEERAHAGPGLKAIGWVLGLGLPLAAAWVLRGRASWVNAVCAGWVVIAVIYPGDPHAEISIFEYLWCGLGAVGLIVWGVRESRTERINLGMAWFALTVLTFYFSSVMDKLDRSVSLIGLGLLFLGGGWALEKMRRRLVARVKQVAA
ncbi:MAG TPA: DUF2157 domain-containing protein [Bryobacteraceae bacterium]|jgi:uncharacterized membrane protein